MAFGLSDLTIGNGLIAAFVAGIALGATEHEVLEAFTGFSENVSAVFQVLTFVVFGALVVSTGYEGSVWALAGFVIFTLVIARPAAILLSFLRSRIPRSQQLFSSPGSVPRVSLRCCSRCSCSTPKRHRSVVFDVAAFVILASILAHGLTDTVGAGWIERRMEEQAAGDAEGEFRP